MSEERGRNRGRTAWTRLWRRQMVIRCLPNVAYLTNNSPEHRPTFNRNTVACKIAPPIERPRDCYVYIHLTKWSCCECYYFYLAVSRARWHGTTTSSKSSTSSRKWIKIFTNLWDLLRFVLFFFLKTFSHFGLFSFHFSCIVFWSFSQSKCF